MNSLKAKRIVAVAGGAALLGLGLAFAAPVTFQSVPIINNAGAPVVQVVLGHGAQPSDGVAAASIAAAIGNLAYVSTPVTASVNATQAAKVLGASVPSSAYTLTNEQVYLNESASAATSSSGNVYSFSALIGSILNHAIQLSAPLNTKSIQNSSNLGGTTYAYNAISNSITPLPSPYVAYGSPSVTSVSASYNGGGLAFSSFRTGNGNFDNILRVGPGHLTSLLNNFGTNGETEYLWIAGFPVYNQHTKQFNLASATGAYQVVFNTPIKVKTSSNTVNNANITLLGQQWVILNYTSTPGGAVSNSHTVSGGKIQLAQALTNVKTLYVGQNYTYQNFTIQLVDLGRANSQGHSPAILNIYYGSGKTPSNTTSVYAPNLTKFNVSGHILFLKVKNVTNGYTVQYAKLQAYSNVYNVTSSQVLNQSNDPGWDAELLWTNATTGKPDELQSIIFVNNSATTLTPGQSFSFIQSPSAYKLTFVGQTLSSANYDPVTVTSEQTGTVTYANLGTAAGLSGANAISNVTEPAQELVVTSTIPGAFTAGSAPQSSTLTYDLTPYQLNSTTTNTPSTATVNIAAPTAAEDAQVSSSAPLTVTVEGYNGLTHISKSFSVKTALTSGFLSIGSVTGGFTNVTAIKLSRALPGVKVQVTEGSSTFASLDYNATPYVLFAPASGKTYDQVTSGSTATYNQHNGQPTTDFNLTSQGQSVSFNGGSSKEYWTYTMNELAVANHASEQDGIAFGLFNNTAGINSQPLFILNGTVDGAKNNVTYYPTTGTANFINANQSFITERGSKVASIGPYSITFDIATAVDGLMFDVAPSSASTSNAVSYATYGPYGVGQSTNLANVSIAKVTANVSVTPGHFTVTGINNLTATPSVSSADTPVLLKNLSAGAANNLVVLDSQANPSSTLVLVGSGYVNSLSAQLEKALNISITPSTPVLSAYAANTTRGARILVAGYYANQTTAEANTFIQDLYSAAASS